MLCFCPKVENEDGLIVLLNQGRWDKDIYEYLIGIMLEGESKLLNYDPVELFEMQVDLANENELVYFQFWNKSESGIYKSFKYNMSEKQQKFFDLFVIRIREIYQSLQKLVINN